MLPGLSSPSVFVETAVTWLVSNDNLHLRAFIPLENFTELRKCQALR